MKIPFTKLDKIAKQRLLNVGMVWALSLWILALGFIAIQNQWGNDFIQFWAGARTLLDGGDPYIKLFDYPEIGPMVDSQFLPLPWVAILFIPLAWMPFHVAKITWIVIGLGILILILKVVYDLGRQYLPIWGLSLIGISVIMLSTRTLSSGQLGILVLLVILIGLKHLIRENWFLSGFWFGLTLIKPWIAIGILIAVGIIVIKERRWQFVYGFLLSFIILIVISNSIWPQWWENYFRVDFYEAYGVWEDGKLVEYWPLATLHDFLRYVLGWNLTPGSEIVTWVILVSMVLSLGIVILYQWYRRKGSFWMLISTYSLLGVMIFPYIRYYDYLVISLWILGWFIELHEIHVSPRWLIINTLIIIAAFVCNRGNHPEPWVFQMLLWFYAASWMNVLIIIKHPDWNRVNHFLL